MIFLTKKKDVYAEAAAAFVRQHWPEAVVLRGERGQEPPHGGYRFENPDWIISYLYPHILEDWFLEIAKKGAINFHPSKYRGAGGPNWAIYNGDKMYRALAHYMTPKLDDGDIINLWDMPIHPTDTPYSIYQRARHHLIIIFYETIEDILRGHSPQKVAIWPDKKLYTLAMLDELGRITPDMPEQEVERRIKATTYPGWTGAYVDLNGYRFRLEVS